jgi:hypothetical protein
MKTDSLLRSVAASLYLNPNKIIVGQEKDFAKNPRVFIECDQPLIPVKFDFFFLIIDKQ